MGVFNIFQNHRKVLGLNARYLDYIRPHNRHQATRIADDKILTKRVLRKAEVPTPKLISVIRDYSQLESFNFDELPSSFVIKPVNGVEGRGIEIFYNRKDAKWIRADGSKMGVDELKDHCRDILQGRYSLYNSPDRVMFEERVRSHKAFRNYTYKGTPDVRIVVFNSIPIMSYIRIPTAESGGRANLQIGAIGSALDIAVGRVTTSIKGKAGEIEYVPGTKLRLAGLQIPFWDEILTYAVKVQQATKLGYAAIDFLIDRDEGPMVVELNARPGLSIQLADQEGIRARLERARGIKVSTVAQGVRLGKDMFGGEIEEEIENISGRTIIGLLEKVILYSSDEKSQEPVLAKVDTGADRTSIDEELMRKLGYGEVVDYFKSFNYGLYKTKEEAKVVTAERDRLIEAGEVEEHPLIAKRAIVAAGNGVTIRPVLKAKIEIGGRTIQTEVTSTNRSDLKYKMIIGKKDLANFLIDPARTTR